MRNYKMYRLIRNECLFTFLLTTIFVSILATDVVSQSGLILGTGPYIGTTDLSDTVRIWGYMDGNYENIWSNSERHHFYSVSIGDVDNDDDREVVASRCRSVNLRGKQPRTIYYTIIEIYEQGSTGLPDRSFELQLHEQEIYWCVETAIADVNGDLENELVLKTSRRIIIYDVPSDDIPTQPIFESQDWVEDFHGVGLAIGDVNTNALGNEIIVSTYSDYIVIWEFSYTTVWNPIKSEYAFPTPSGLGHLCIGDIDGDTVNEILGENPNEGLPCVFGWEWDGTKYGLILSQEITFEGIDFVWGIGAGQLDTDPACEVAVAARYSISTSRRESVSGSRLILFDCVETDGGDYPFKLKLRWDADLVDVLLNQVIVGDSDGDNNMEVIGSGCARILSSGRRSGAKLILYINVFNEDGKSEWYIAGNGGEIWDIDLISSEG